MRNLAAQALASAQGLLARSGEGFQAAASRLGDHLSLAALREQAARIPWEETLDRALTQAISATRAPTLRVLLQDDRVRALCDILMELLPTSARYAIMLSLGREGLEARLLQMRDRLLTGLTPAALDAPLAQSLPQLVGSGALKRQLQSLSSGMRGDVGSSLARLEAVGGSGTRPQGAMPAMAG